jgi:cytochrome c peroxidase
VGYHANGLYWDGRAATLEAQATGALAGGNMGVGKEGLEAKAKEIGALPEYAAQFVAVFGLADASEVSMDHVVMALSAYERTLLCGDTAFDKDELSEAAQYKFRTPTLRNVAKTAPYFHNGSVATLEEAVAYMAAGGNAKAPGVDQNLRNTGLSPEEVADVVEFLRALDCPGQLEVIGDQSVPGIWPAAAAPAAG